MAIEIGDEYQMEKISSLYVKTCNYVRENVRALQVPVSENSNDGTKSVTGHDPSSRRFGAHFFKRQLVRRCNDPHFLNFLLVENQRCDEKY